MSVIFLNGCTSAGKTSIARSLQDQAATPHLLTGIDDAFALLPPRFHNHSEGFYFDRNTDGLVRLNLGKLGLQTLKAHHRSAAAIAAGGVSLILDEVVLTAELREDWLNAMKGIDVFRVGVFCDLPELERREIARGDRVPGQARGQFDLVHAGMTYDLTVDTTKTPPAACAARILSAANRD